MATYRRTDSGRWEAQIARKGIRKSGTFPTKAHAQAWAGRVEAEILAESSGQIPDKSFGDLLARYAKEISPTKRGERWEVIRIAKLQTDKIAKVRLADLNEKDIAGWRDRRLRDVSAESVRREWNLLSNACKVAVNEWKWLKNHPMKVVKRPPPAKPRDRILSESEIDALCVALGFDMTIQPATVSARVGAAMLFAVETGMRAGEICRLQARDCSESVAVVRSGKTAAASRRVPLSNKARSIIKLMASDQSTDQSAGKTDQSTDQSAGKTDQSADQSVFNLNESQVDSMFRKGKMLAGITDLHFHDTRHTAITRLAKVIPVLDLARMVGHRDIKMLMIYYNESAEDIAKRLP